MENEIEHVIRLGKQELEKRVEQDPLLPRRLQSRLQARRRHAHGLARKLGWASAFCLVIAMLTFIHLQWLTGLASRPVSGQQTVQLSPFPGELQNTIYHSYFEVAKWEK